MKNLKDWFIIAGIIALILILVFKGERKQIFEVSPTKIIENRIEYKEDSIQVYMNRIDNSKEFMNQINESIESLRSDLNDVKSKRDTLMMVQIQDTLISTLSFQNDSLKYIVSNQDSVIIAQRYIINSKDTIIARSDFDIKKVKRQRNISLLINAIQTGIIILK